MSCVDCTGAHGRRRFPPPWSRLVLERPLVVFDLETTGTNASEDRIVQIAVVRVEPETVETWHQLVDPGRPIPAEATAVHHITDAMVADAPTFAALSGRVVKLLDGADLAGFNVRRFDARVLEAEMKRAGRPFSLEGRRVVDAMSIFFAHEPRDLGAAVRHYLGRDHAGAHDALADALATWDVIEAQIDRHGLRGDVAALAAIGVDPDAIDGDGKFKWVDGVAVIDFGKHKGMPLPALAKTQSGFLRWMLSNDFSDEVKGIAKRALAGQFPTRKAVSVEPDEPGGH